jgi:SAM-dependent methyltransferase
MRSGPPLLVYALTLFLSALLLFLVQPLIGKLIVPLLGGSPAIWNTCMVFFQAMLLAGYAYAHYSADWLGERRQTVLHLAVLLLPALVLPLGVSTRFLPSGGGNPVPGVLLLLLVSAGLPFFAVAATAPLLQRWFANTTHPAAKDPYFLYAASNAGSMLALIAYPTVIEPRMTLAHQRLAWSIGYGLLVLLLVVCAVLFRRSSVPPKETEPPSPDGDEVITPRRALRWVALAFVPSSLMLGVTTYMTTDIAAIPLLWVIPLALYLLSFILVFSSLTAWVHRLAVLALPVLLLLLAFLMVSKIQTRMWTVLLVHLVGLLTVAVVCHGELAEDRPAPRHLTRFYLLMSLGGVLGGLFNALLAPLIFTSTAEYPLVLVLAAFLIPRLRSADGPTARRTRWLDFLLPAAVGLLCLEFFGVRYGGRFPLANALLPEETSQRIADMVTDLARGTGFSTYNLTVILCYAPPIMLVYVLVDRPLRFGLGVAAVFLVGALPAEFDPATVYRGRSFFGVLTIKGGLDPWGRDGEPTSHRLFHGNILHGKQYEGEPGPAFLLAEISGAQALAPASAPLGSTAQMLSASRLAMVSLAPRTEPITYYARGGPIGQLFGVLPGQSSPRDVAVVGLGTGTMAAYARPGDHYTFYEIDRAVKELSFDQSRYFSYVTDAKERGAEVDIVLGDARLSLDREREAGRKFDLIVVDAFSSDAIPVHLLTREALRVYRGRLKDDGVVVFHTSNRYLGLEPVVANVAAAEGMAALMMKDSAGANPQGKVSSTWVAVANREEDFGALNEKPRWVRPPEDEWVGVWTDDYSNLLRVFQWKGTNN